MGLLISDAKGIMERGKSKPLLDRQRLPLPYDHYKLMAMV